MAFPAAANNFIPSAPVPAPIPALSALDAARAAVTAVEARRKALLSSTTASEKDLDRADRDLALAVRGLEQAELSEKDADAKIIAALASRCEENYLKIIPKWEAAEARFTVAFKAIFEASEEMALLAGRLRAETHYGAAGDLIAGVNPDHFRRQILEDWLGRRDVAAASRASYTKEFWAHYLVLDAHAQAEAVARQTSYRRACGIDA
jgi:hypothetical protein